MSYKIGSFNVRNLSFSSDKEKLDAIADIIKKFDIIALQEVLSEGKALDNILYRIDRLGIKWDKRWLEPKSDSKDSRGEGYAFFWRKDKFKLPVNEKGKIFEPRIFDRYKVDKREGQKELIRNPAYARFQPIWLPNAEIRLITTHIIFGDAIEDRRNEFDILTEQIYTRICDDHYSNQPIRPYTIMLGDYNFNLKESGATSPYIDAVTVLDGHNHKIALSNGKIVNECYVLQTQQLDLSTVNQAGNDYKSNYDHFTYDESIGDTIIKQNPHRLQVVKKGEDLNKYLETVSDHIPIMVEVDFRK